MWEKYNKHINTIIRDTVRFSGTVRRNRCRGGDACCSDSAPCGLGGGDCDGDSECEVGLRCGRDNCRDRRKFWGARGSFSESDDCCERRKGAYTVLQLAAHWK